MKRLAVILTISSVILVVAGFIVPPMGIIDGSVLTAVGEIIGLQAVITAWHAIDKGIDAKIQHNGTSITLTNDDEQGTDN